MHIQILNKIMIYYFAQWMVWPSDKSTSKPQGGLWGFEFFFSIP